ncbi:unnamed protein product [Ranitomeya imitator]|uniref:Ig-like domain-containing protein n=1 Tax=Ranitomeya imitator TaxID=111125 RepID=A0ABN9KS65_9NEOB|nr:unnamed protein product [Ranitomeya imitator]
MENFIMGKYRPKKHSSKIVQCRIRVLSPELQRIGIVWLEICSVFIKGQNVFIDYNERLEQHPGEDISCRTLLGRTPAAIPSGRYRAHIFINRRNGYMWYKYGVVSQSSFYEGRECGFPLSFISPLTLEEELWPHLGTTVSLNCTLSVLGSCNGSVTWQKDGKAAEHPYTGHDTVWNGLNSSVKFLSSILDVNLTTEEDYGRFTCQLHNASASFTLHKTGTDYN